MIYYVKGPYDLPYMVNADNAQEALDKCISYEQTIYDSWASDVYDEDGNDCSDAWPYASDFRHITLEEFREYGSYNDLVNYDWSKCVWGTHEFCEIREQE